MICYNFLQPLYNCYSHYISNIHINFYFCCGLVDWIISYIKVTSDLVFLKCMHKICYLYILIYWYWYTDLFCIYWFYHYYCLFLLLLAKFITFAQLAILWIAHFIILSEVRWWWNSHAKSEIMQLWRTTMQYNVTTTSYGCKLNVIKLTYKHIISFYKTAHSLGTA